MKSPIKKVQKKEFRRIVEYLISGGTYFWSGYLTFFVLYQLFHWTLWWAKILADIVGWLVNYGLQRYWVFNDSDLSERKIQVTARYVIITLVDFIVDYFIVRGLQILGLTPYLGQFASAGFFTVWNYFWYKYWVFPVKS